MAASVKENKPGRGFYIEEGHGREAARQGQREKYEVLADGSESHGCSSHEDNHYLSAHDYVP